MHNIKEQTINGIVWSSLERFSAQFIQFGIGIIMARLLMPADFGIIGMVAVFMAISQSIIDSGFTSALIQKKNRTNIDYSTVFYFNIVVGVVLYLVLFLMAPLIARFYKLPELELITRVFAINLFINSFAVVQRAILSIEINFKLQAKLSFISALVGGTIGLVMALNDYGVWAIIMQSITSNILITALFWVYVKWRPLFLFSKESFKSLFAFGSKLLISGLIITVYNNIYQLIIGKFCSAGDLGYYTRAQNFVNLPSSNIIGIIERVNFPIMCSIQDDKERLTKIYKLYIKLTVFILVPIMAVIAIISQPLILLLLTEKWLPSANLLLMLSIGAMTVPIHTINLNLLKVKGRSDLVLKLEIIKKTLGTLIVVTTAFWGLNAIVLGYVIYVYASILFNTHYTSKIIDYSLKNQLRDVFPFYLVSFMLIFVLKQVVNLINSPIIQLFTGIGLGFGIYILVFYLLRSEELKQCTEIFKTIGAKINRRKKI